MSYDYPFAHRIEDRLQKRALCAQCRFGVRELAAAV